MNPRPQHRKLPLSKTSSEKSTYEVGLGNKLPILDKLIQIIGVVLLYLIGLCGSEDIYSKKRA